MTHLIENISVPLLWEPPPVSCRLVRWLVRDGEHVCIHQVIYELEVDGNLIDVESFHTGPMKQIVAEGTACRVGDRIATILVDEMSTRFKTLPLYLSGREAAVLDSLRGEVCREVFIRETFLKAMGIDPATGNKPVELDGDAGQDAAGTV